MNDEYSQIVMSIIMQGGDAKNDCMTAIKAAKEGNFTTAQQSLKDADQALMKAHDVQTKLLTQEAQGHHTEVNLYMVHAQDWLMNGITFKDLTTEIVALYQTMAGNKSNN
ncbi:PTS lactose/cellobiose transporter subunit IIA [Furfurilactobacillus curtus]|uniref:PTS cellobiose transporter subunit IIA n=1 Tax=Furfurilactobacillus curtus TaxID=1746200 RepID=A0ABQ5JS53_9LACO